MFLRTTVESRSSPGRHILIKYIFVWGLFVVIFLLVLAACALNANCEDIFCVGVITHSIFILFSMSCISFFFFIS